MNNKFWSDEILRLYFETRSLTKAKQIVHEMMKEQLQMNIQKLLDMQRELDNFITKKYDPSMMPEDFLVYRLLALQVEVSEFANATRCFKYWSDKEAEPRERLLDEYADILHFLLSIGNIMEFTGRDIEEAYLKKHKENYKRQEVGY